VNNPYRPPSSDVSDVAATQAVGWPRALATSAVCAALALFLAWLVVPIIAFNAANMVRGPSPATDTPELLIDLVLSAAVFFAAAYAAATLSTGRAWLAAMTVAAIGWLVYFAQSGGATGILSGEFPLWYHLAPSHLGTAVAAALAASRRQARRA